MDFDLLPLKSKRAAFAKMSAKKKAGSALKSAAKGAKAKQAPAKHSRKPGPATKKSSPPRQDKPGGSDKKTLGDFGVKRENQLSAEYARTGVGTDKDLDVIQKNYEAMHGRPMTKAQVEGLKTNREKRKRKNARDQKALDRYRASQGK